MIKFQQFQALTSHFESFWSIVLWKLTWASCKVQHESHWNLLSLHRVSVLLKFFKQLVIDVFCSTSMLKSKKSSSLLVTVSQFKHRVSLVKMPWKMSLIHVDFLPFSVFVSLGIDLFGFELLFWFLSAEKSNKVWIKKNHTYTHYAPETFRMWS